MLSAYCWGTVINRDFRFVHPWIKMVEFDLICAKVPLQKRDSLSAYVIVWPNRKPYTMGNNYVHLDDWAVRFPPSFGCCGPVGVRGLPRQRFRLRTYTALPTRRDVIGVKAKNSGDVYGNAIYFHCTSFPNGITLSSSNGCRWVRVREWANSWPQPSTPMNGYRYATAYNNLLFRRVAANTRWIFVRSNAAVVRLAFRTSPPPYGTRWKPPYSSVGLFFFPQHRALTVL